MVDAWRVSLGGSREPQRLTRFLDFKGFEASNSVFGDDRGPMAFQLGIGVDEAGVSYGLL